MVPHERIPRRSHQRGQPRQDVDRRRHAVRAAAAGILHAVRHAAVAEHTQPIEGKAGPCALPHEPLAPFVVGLDADRCLNVEAAAVGGERASLLSITVADEPIPRFFGGGQPVRTPTISQEIQSRSGAPSLVATVVLGSKRASALSEQEALRWAMMANEPPRRATSARASSAPRSGCSLPRFPERRSSRRPRLRSQRRLRSRTRRTARSSISPEGGARVEADLADVVRCEDVIGNDGVVVEV